SFETGEHVLLWRLPRSDVAGRRIGVEIPKRPSGAEAEIEIAILREILVHPVGHLQANAIFCLRSPDWGERLFDGLDGIPVILLDGSLARSGVIELVILQREATDLMQ